MEDNLALLLYLGLCLLRSLCCSLGLPLHVSQLPFQIRNLIGLTVDVLLQLCAFTDKFVPFSLQFAILGLRGLSQDPLWDFSGTPRGSSGILGPLVRWVPLACFR